MEIDLAIDPGRLDAGRPQRLKPEFRQLDDTAEAVPFPKTRF
jgi:hypothetical protein